MQGARVDDGGDFGVPVSYPEKLRVRMDLCLIDWLLD